MKRFFLPTTALSLMAALAMGALPSEAHGTAGAGALAGLAHPLLGVDHLLMLLAVGTAASQLSFLLLPWALGGGVVGAISCNLGWSLPLLEALAPLAVVAVAGLTLLWSGKGSADRTSRWLSGIAVGTAVAIHGVLHGLEAPGDGGGALLWWGGALLTSAVLCGGTALLLRRGPGEVGRAFALVLLMAGGVLLSGS